MKNQIVFENNKRIEGLGVGWPQAHEGRRPSAQQKHVHDVGGKNKCLRFNGHTSNAPGSQPRPITKIRNTPRLVKSCYCLSCSLTLFVSPTQPQPHKYGRTPAPVGVSKTSIGCPTNMEKIHGNVEVAALVPKEWAELLPHIWTGELPQQPRGRKNNSKPSHQTATGNESLWK